jgi:hypothetical protein
LDSSKDKWRRLLQLLSPIDWGNGAERAEYGQDFLPVLIAMLGRRKCAAPNRGAQSRQQSGQPVRFKSVGKYIDRASRRSRWISIALNQLPRRRRACPDDEPQWGGRLHGLIPADFHIAANQRLIPASSWHKRCRREILRSVL